MANKNLSKLLCACRDGDLAKVERILQKALRAVSRDAAYLLSTEIMFSQDTPNGTAFDVAVRHGHLDIIQYLWSAAEILDDGHSYAQHQFRCLRSLEALDDITDPEIADFLLEKAFAVSGAPALEHQAFRMVNRWLQREDENASPDIAVLAVQKVATLSSPEAASKLLTEIVGTKLRQLNDLSGQEMVQKFNRLFDDAAILPHAPTFGSFVTNPDFYAPNIYSYGMHVLFWNAAAAAGQETLSNLMHARVNYIQVSPGWRFPNEKRQALLSYQGAIAEYLEGNVRLGLMQPKQLQDFYAAIPDGLRQGINIHQLQVMLGRTTQSKQAGRA